MTFGQLCKQQEHSIIHNVKSEEDTAYENFTPNLKIERLFPIKKEGPK